VDKLPGVAVSLGNAHTGYSLRVAVDAQARLLITLPLGQTLRPMTPLRIGVASKIALLRNSGNLQLYIDGVFIISAVSDFALPKELVLSVGADLIDPTARLYGAVEDLEFISGSTRPPVSQPTKTPVWRRSGQPTMPPTPFSMVYSYSSSMNFGQGKKK
jgi:hypothetical protein